MAAQIVAAGNPLVEKGRVLPHMRIEAVGIYSKRLSACAFVINSLSGTKNISDGGAVADAKHLPARTKPNFAGPASPGEHFSSGVRRAFHFPKNAGVGFYPIYRFRQLHDVHIKRAAGIVEFGFPPGSDKHNMTS